jgi:alpha-glucosidase (family GH31 glycosyl hydrolase)
VTPKTRIVHSFSYPPLRPSPRLQDYLLSAARESEEGGVPVVRPVWWLAPHDTITFTLDSQFMVGDRLMVAPVQTQGKFQRS